MRPTLGAPQAGRRWWRTARRTSHQLSDAETATFVLGQQAILGMYCGYSPDQVLQLTEEALHTSNRDLVCPGTVTAVAARAQALSLLGRVDEARQALDQQRRLFDHLSNDSTNASANWFAYPEYRVLHTESYVNTRIGRKREAIQAQEAAIQIYPQDKYRGLSQVELHHATCMIMDGYVDEGIQHVTATMHALPVDLRGDRLIRHVAHAAISAVPASTESAAPVRDLREWLALSHRTV